MAIESLQPVVASASLPYETLQTVRASASLPYEVLQTVAAELALPYEVVAEAVDELATLPVEELQEIGSILERAVAAGTGAIDYAADLARRVRGAQTTQVLVRALDTVARVEIVKQMIEYLIKHHS